MRCKKCGFETPNNSNFCSHCGAPIDFDDEFINIDSKIEEEKEEDTTNTNQNMNLMDIDMSRASIGWYFLGLLFPIVGLILFFLFLYKKPDLAFKARRGAIHGFLISVVLTFLLILRTIL